MSVKKFHDTKKANTAVGVRQYTNRTIEDILAEGVAVAPIDHTSAKAKPKKIKVCPDCNKNKVYRGKYCIVCKDERRQQQNRSYAFRPYKK